MIRMIKSTSRWLTALGSLLLTGMLGGCGSEPAVDQILTPIHMKFEDLFAVVDTVRLDATVLIGSISMLNVNSSGEFLIQDNQSERIHVFSPSGTYRRTLSITDCNPEANLDFRSSSTYLDDSRIFVLTSKAAMIFNQSGQCILSSSDKDIVTNTWSVCEFRDTIFAMPRNIQNSTFIRAYDPGLSFIRQFSLPAPRFPRKTAVRLPYQGGTMGCFRDDVWWVYGEDFDATPRFRRAGLIQFRPDFYRIRTKDYPETPLIDQSNFSAITRLLDEADAEASSVLRMLALNETTRLVVYGAIAGGNDEHNLGALIASPEGDFGGLSTLLTDVPSAARLGMLYFTEDPEDAPDGELANPTIIRYRFIPPADG